MSTAHAFISYAKAPQDNPFSFEWNSVQRFVVQGAVGMAAGAATKLSLTAGAAFLGLPAIATVAATALATGVVSAKISHWFDCREARKKGETPPAFTFKEYGLQGIFSAAMFGAGHYFSEDILNAFTPSSAAAATLTDAAPILTEPSALAPPTLLDPVPSANHLPQPSVNFVQDVQTTPDFKDFSPRPEIQTVSNIAPPPIEKPVQVASLAPEFQAVMNDAAPHSWAMPEISSETPEAIPDIKPIQVASLETAPPPQPEPQIPEPSAHPFDGLDVGSKAQAALDAHLAGNAQATADLGYYFFHGEQGLPQDYAKAVEYYREAAAQGNHHALRDLAYVESVAERHQGVSLPSQPTVPTPAPAPLTPEPAAIERNAHTTPTTQTAIPPRELTTDMLNKLSLESVRTGASLQDLIAQFQQGTVAAPAAVPAPHPPVAVQPALPLGTEQAVCQETMRTGQGIKPEFVYQCNFNDPDKMIHPGEFVTVNSSQGVAHEFRMAESAKALPTDNFLQYSVLPEMATKPFVELWNP